MYDIDGYRILISYLEDHYFVSHSDILGALLGGMALSKDGSTMDPAYGVDWNDAVLSLSCGGTLSKNSRAAALLFLDRQLSTLPYNDLADIRKELGGQSGAAAWRNAAARIGINPE